MFGDFINDYTVKYSPSFIQARQINIHNILPFYESEQFSHNRFIHDKKRKVIVQNM